LIVAFLFLFLLLLILLFGFVVFFGAPYLPTLKTQADEALKLLDLKPGQTLLELGCGDGRVLRLAAEQGCTAVGYELNPLLVLAARIRTWRHRKNVRVVWGNYWTAKWPPADGIFVFLLDKYMNKLDKKIIQEYKESVKLVSFAFKVPGKVAAKESKGLYLYEY
jgi:SAM-dependent methyltransferase